MCVVKQAWCFYTGFFIYASFALLGALCVARMISTQRMQRIRKERKGDYL